MNYDDRMAEVRRGLRAFLSTYVPPRGISEEAQAQIVRNMADGLCRRLPVTDAATFVANLAKTFDAVRDAHGGYTWPTQAELMAATPRGVIDGNARQQYRPDNALDVMATRMNAGQPVAEFYVWGTGAAALRNANLVSQETLDAYRRGSVASTVATYRHDAYKIMEQRLGDVVLPYLRDGAA